MFKSLIIAVSSLALIASSAPAFAKKNKVDFSKSIGTNYQPIDDDEKGLWYQMNEAEKELKNSKLIIDDPELNTYIQSVLCRTVGEDECKGIRVYLMRTPYFNASMAPNGMMQVWSGLLTRMRNEAQLASVLAHEYGHYTRRHSLQSFRNIKSKTSSGFFLSMIIPFAGLLTIDSIFSFNRDMEREADKLSLGYLEKAGYDPIAASSIWQQLRDEQDATAAERKVKSRKDKTGGLFATHPSSKERMETLRKMAELSEMKNGDLGEERFRKALAPWWPTLIDDQIKMNDFGATEFLLNQLASKGWTSDLLYARGELYRSRGGEGDFEKAATFYTQAIGSKEAVAESWRGLGLALLRSGKKDEGREALKEYLRRKPDAEDKAMIGLMSGGV